MWPDNQKTVALRRALYAERNGVVADTMARLGIHYAENWGVSLATVRRIARELKRDVEWANELWQSDLRELKIVALWLGHTPNPSELTTPELSDEWEFIRK